MSIHYATRGGAVKEFPTRPARGRLGRLGRGERSRARFGSRPRRRALGSRSPEQSQSSTWPCTAMISERAIEAPARRGGFSSVLAGATRGLLERAGHQRADLRVAHAEPQQLVHAHQQRAVLLARRAPRRRTRCACAAEAPSSARRRATTGTRRPRGPRPRAAASRASRSGRAARACWRPRPPPRRRAMRPTGPRGRSRAPRPAGWLLAKQSRGPNPRRFEPSLPFPSESRARDHTPRRTRWEAAVAQEVASPRRLALGLGFDRVGEVLGVVERERATQSRQHARPAQGVLGDLAQRCSASAIGTSRITSPWSSTITGSARPGAGSTTSISPRRRRRRR